VKVTLPGATPRAMRVVGRVVLPTFFTVRPGEGALMGSVSKAFPDLPRKYRGESDLFVRFRPGVGRAAGVARLRERLGNETVSIRSGDKASLNQVLTELPRETPADLANFGRVENFPVILGGLIALLAAASLAHTVASAVRRRARDLAILKTIGFDRAGVQAAVAWQATTLTVVALVAGIPLGIAAGRWAWRLFADQLGVITEPRVSAAAMLIMIPAALLLANAIGALPARAAARVHPALVLRAE
jgi:putative ABC transport system permease protein